MEKETKRGGKWGQSGAEVKREEKMRNRGKEGMMKEE